LTATVSSVAEDTIELERLILVAAELVEPRVQEALHGATS
jgi:hypothetical protein